MSLITYCIARSSVAMLLTELDVQVIVLYEEWFQLPVPVLIMIDNANQWVYCINK